ncbi:restriction endonuclease subunit S [Aeromonas bivalvium]|uniref:restriction endonuclease subunit S n=1 Tax=Aeromonas bivalvium TaxID=440079 RepID=UPI000DD0CB53|nr:restriction endonuclease subunit S [Aeromonas bivalvium]
MVPKGWKKTHLKCVISGAIKNGYSPLPASTTTGYWVLSLGALTDHGINPLEIKPVVVDEKVKQALLSGGDFLVSRSNTPNKVGRSIRFKNEVQNCSYPDLMMRFCIDTTKADPDFIEIKLKSTEVRQYYKSCAAGSSSSMVKINKAVVENTPLLLPSFPEQKKIAKILSTWDKAISTTEQLLANSQQQKKALMQQLLIGKKRLLDSNGVRFSGEWKAQRIGSLLKEVKRPVQWDDDSEYHLLSVKRRSEGVVLREILKGSDILTKKMNTALAGDFLISKMQVVHGATGLVTEEFNKCHISDSYIALRPKDDEKIDIAFFSWFSKQKIMYHKAFLCSYGVHIEKMTFNFNMFVKEKVIIPATLEEQQKIAAVLSTADQEITALQQKLDALKQEKKALMQQLLTGKRRVKVEEVA